VLEAFGKIGLRPGHPAVDRGIAYLRRTQEADGSWFGRWGVNYIYGTWQAIEGLRAVGLPAAGRRRACGASACPATCRSCCGN
jgi:squalene-hopene/tetraprenyl-beta-curcumene cyclase